MLGLDQQILIGTPLHIVLKHGGFQMKYLEKVEGSESKAIQKQIRICSSKWD